MLFTKVSTCGLRGGGGVLAYVRRVRGFAIIFGTFLGVLPDFWIPFWATFRFWGTFWAIPRFLGIIFLVKFHFFRNTLDFWVLILIFY